jgi:hypothetical protein
MVSTFELFTTFSDDTLDVECFFQISKRPFPPFGAKFHPSVQNRSALQLICQKVRSTSRKTLLWKDHVKSMEVKPMLALPDELEVTGIEMRDEGLTITVVSKQLCACCSLCSTEASRLHSRYTRAVADLPCGGQQVRLLVGVRRYFCDVPTCQRKIFAERLTPFVEPRARVTQRLYQIVHIIGLATGGRLGVRVTDRLQIQTSRHTILRRILALPHEPVGEVLQIGIDDFSDPSGSQVWDHRSGSTNA